MALSAPAERRAAAGARTFITSSTRAPDCRRSALPPTLSPPRYDRGPAAMADGAGRRADRILRLERRVDHRPGPAQRLVRRQCAKPRPPGTPSLPHRVLAP